MSDCRHGGKDVPSATDAVRALVERYEKRIAEVETQARLVNCLFDAAVRRTIALEKIAVEMFDVAAAGEFDVGEEARFARRFEELGIEVAE